MTEKELIIALDTEIARSGSKAQIHYVLKQAEPQGLTLEDIATLTGLTVSTTYTRLRELFHAQIVEEVRSAEKRVYRLIEPSRHLAIASPEREIRSPEDISP